MYVKILLELNANAAFKNPRVCTAFVPTNRGLPIVTSVQVNAGCCIVHGQHQRDELPSCLDSPFLSLPLTL